jgi:4'-phosphopantetheinyl transferase
MNDVVVTRLHTEPDAIRASVRLLSGEERRRADRFLFARDRNRFIAARATLRQLLAVRLDADPASLELSYGKHRKPSVADSALRFNMSRCEEMAVYAFAVGGEIGVDVEAIRFVCDADDIVARFFSRYENDEYRHLDPHQKQEGFFNCWTRKEAFVKAAGEGLSASLDAFDVSLAPGAPARVVRIGTTYGDACGWSIDSFTPAAGFVAAVVTQVSA